MSKELNELIQGLGKLVDGYKNTAEELDQLKSLYEQLKLNFDEEFKCPFRENEPYWLVDENGDIHGLKWDNEGYDHPRYEQGHIFKTKQEAERERDKRALLVRFRQFRDKCNGDWNPNWNTAEEKKYFIELYPMKALCSISEDVFRSSLPLFGHFKTVDDCKRAIELFGQEINQLYGLEW